MKFLKSIHCESGAHCDVCRSILAGRVFREDLRNSFDDITENLFDCPESKPWVKTKVKRLGNKVYLDGKECIPCQKKLERSEE